MDAEQEQCFGYAVSCEVSVVSVSIHVVSTYGRYVYIRVEVEGSIKLVHCIVLLCIV